MSSIRNIVLGCVSDHGHETPQTSIISPPKRMAKVKFGVPIISILVDGDLPEPLVDIIVYIARDGVATSDLFRRPGSHSDLKVIMRRLNDGYPVHLSEYNFYTLASVIKMFLLRIPGGLFGADIERHLLNVLELNNRVDQCDAINRIMASLPGATQHLVALLFGTWFRVVNHCEYNAMTSEAMAKSVAGSVFHTCAAQPTKVNDAVRLIRIIIDNFGAAGVLGRPNVQYFTERTCTAIRVREKYKYQLTGVCPAGVSTSVGELSEPFHLECVDECRSAFARIVMADAACRGIDPVHHGEMDFYGKVLRVPSRDASVRRVSEEITSTKLSVELYGPSPNMLPRSSHGDAVTGQNLHPRLTHMSSLSAPDVNESCLDSCSDASEMLTVPCLSGSYASTSLNRVESVRNRQLLRMRKRSDWFLNPSPKNGNIDDADQNNVTDSLKEPSLTPLPQLCINDIAAYEGDLLGKEVLCSNNDISMSLTGHSPLSAGSVDCSPSIPSRCSNASADRSTSDVRRKTIESYATGLDGIRPAERIATVDYASSTSSLGDPSLQLEAHYFVVDHFYGKNSVEKANGGKLLD